jgi:hypothetical protein
VTGWESIDAPLRPYALLLNDERITPTELEALYLPSFKKDRTVWDEEPFNILNEFFLDLDDYAPDASSDDHSPAIDQQELQQRGAKALDALTALAKSRPQSSSQLVERSEGSPGVYLRR